jgi:subtilisin family serine protease
MNAFTKGLAAAAIGALALVSVAAEPDPYRRSSGSWGQSYADQWALERIGLPAEPPRAQSPVVVAVIDTGLDFFHPDLARESVWVNPNEEPNGRDDDGNGYVDDLIGWNFLENDNNPWDVSGHGTVVSGILAANTNNGVGIAGVAPGVQIMPLKAMNFAGHGRSSHIAAAIFYAVRHGARVINLSLGSENRSRLEDLALEYAEKKNVVVVAAAGNAGRPLDEMGPAGGATVLSVVATAPGDALAEFSNFGEEVDLAAPGVDVLSLRARRTDLDLTIVRDYRAGDHIVGEDAKYYRVTGTSFAAPFVAGAAALLLARDPGLTAAEVRRMLTQSARDIEEPGVDPGTGHGLLDIAAALTTDRAFFIDAAIDEVRVVQAKKGYALEILGTADADKLKTARVELGMGEAPDKWKTVIDGIKGPIDGAALGSIPVEAVQETKVWTFRLIVEHLNGRTREARYRLTLD